MAACAHEAYMYNYVLYDTEELALAAQVSDIQMVLSKVQRKDKPIGESCVVIVPSVGYLESMIKEAMIREGRGRGVEAQSKGVSYLAKLWHRGLRAAAEAVVARNLFHHVVVRESDDFDSAVGLPDVVLLAVQREGKLKWLLKKEGSGAIVREVEEVSGALPEATRMTLWLDLVEKAARME
jgi:hypothetical protein